jgi:hypothetical protein
VGVLLRAALASTKPISFMMGGPGRRTLLGGMIGAGLGAGFSDSETSGGVMRDAIAGAVAGLGVGALTT